ANSNNVKQVQDWGGHVNNFVHESIYKDRADANIPTHLQEGDQWAGWKSAVEGGNNWAQEEIHTDGSINYTRSDPSISGIDYYNGADPNNNTGHDYTGQWGDVTGGFHNNGNAHGRPMEKPRA